MKLAENKLVNLHTNCFNKNIHTTHNSLHKNEYACGSKPVLLLLGTQKQLY